MTYCSYSNVQLELSEFMMECLHHFQGSLVEDESLINVLAITKQTAAEVSEKLAVAADTEIKINIAREEFRPGFTKIYFESFLSKMV